MKQYSMWRDPDFWSQVALLLLPLFGFVALLLLAKPNIPQSYQTASRRARDDRVMPRVVIPEALPPDVLQKLSAISTRSLEHDVEQMALEAGQTGAEIKDDAIIEFTPRPSIPVEQEGLPVPQFRVRTLVTGLVSPDGIAIDPRTGNIYVSEEDAHRIAMVTPRGRIRTVIDTATRLVVTDGRTEKRIAPLRSPEGLAMGRFGRLYVVEDREKGRILAIKFLKMARSVLRRSSTCRLKQWSSVGRVSRFETRGSSS